MQYHSHRDAASPGGDPTDVLWLRGFISCIICLTRPDALLDASLHHAIVCFASPIAQVPRLRVLASRLPSAVLVTAGMGWAWYDSLLQRLRRARVARQGPTAT